MIFSYLLNMQSHPSWVCGLKLMCGFDAINEQASHPSWVCGLKLSRWSFGYPLGIVTPFVGVWIETRSSYTTYSEEGVTPFVGVWIETLSRNSLGPQPQVTPFVGVWIETL